MPKRLRGLRHLQTLLVHHAAKPVQLAELKLRRLRQIRIDDAGALGFKDMRIGDQLKQILALDAIDNELVFGIGDLGVGR